MLNQELQSSCANRRRCPGRHTALPLVCSSLQPQPGRHCAVGSVMIFKIWQAQFGESEWSHNVIMNIIMPKFEFRNSMLNHNLRFTAGVGVVISGACGPPLVWRAHKPLPSALRSSAALALGLGRRRAPVPEQRFSGPGFLPAPRIAVFSIKPTFSLGGSDNDPEPEVVLEHGGAPLVAESRRGRRPECTG